jgi:hypothetical protein
MFLKFEHYDLEISEVRHYGFFKKTFFNKLTKRSYGWIQEKNSKKLKWIAWFQKGCFEAILSLKSPWSFRG